MPTREQIAESVKQNHQLSADDMQLSVVDALIDALADKAKLEDDLFELQRVKSVFRFANDALAVCDQLGNQIPRLQGSYTADKHTIISLKSTVATEWHGISPLKFIAPLNQQPRTEVIAAIEREIDRAYAKHGRDLWGRHEFYGIIAEEFDEMFDCIKTNADSSLLREEIIQVAAMCIRFLETGDRFKQGLDV